MKRVKNEELFRRTLDEAPLAPCYFHLPQMCCESYVGDAETAPTDGGRRRV